MSVQSNSICGTRSNISEPQSHQELIKRSLCCYRSMSLVVIYEGQRKVVKIPSPNTLVQALLLDCATQFNVDVAKVAFRHKRTILDNAQPIRFCNLSNNAQVDMISATGSGSAKSQSCKIALAIEGGENTTETFESSISLFDMLTILAARNKVPADIHHRSPEVVYLRAKYAGVELTATTFTSLGLAGQSARLQLRFAACASTSTSATPAPTIEHLSDPVSVPIVSPIVPSVSVEDTGMDVVGPETTPRATAAAVSTEAAMDLVSTASIHTTNSSSTLNSLSSHPTAYPSSTTNPVTTTTTSTLSPTHSASATTAEVASATVVSSVLPTLPTPAATANAILSDNFDRVSVPAVLTLSRYLLNILLNPSEDKFRRISTENKAFQSKIAAAKGAVDFLCSVGFICPAYNNAVLMLASPNTDSNDESTEGGQLAPAQLSLLQEGYAQLLLAMKELEIPLEERPHQGADLKTIQVQLETQRRENEQRSASQVAAFDPYKTHIVRTAPQPVRQKEILKQGDSSNSTADAPNAASAAAPVLALSSTERQLLELNKKRAELEGNRSDVVRATEVLLPRVDAKDSNNTYTTKESGDNYDLPNSSNHNDSRNVPRSVLSKILRCGEEGDSTPLTTQAVRDLQRAQKEKVFNRTLIRIKFPDRACLQGYFHPRDTVQDVYEWVNSCLLSADDSAENKKAECQQQQWCFELYTSPPRTVLVPYRANDCGGSKGSGGSFKGCGTVSGPTKADAPTLSSMGFVPAAVIYLAWKGNTKATPTTVEVGGYFTHVLLAAAVTEDKGATIPTGVSLVPPSATDSKFSSAKHRSHTSGGSSISGVKAGADASADVKKSTKPKWFNLK